MLLKD
jgi:hypothetical protein